MARNRVGGWPALPQGVSWPLVLEPRPMAGTPMCFIAQLDLRDIPESLIPGSGLLYLWCDGQLPDGPGAAHAVLFPGDFL